MKKCLNIAAVSRTTYWQGMRGGMDVHGKLLAKGLADRGHRVIFICTRHPEGKVADIEDGVELHYLPDTVFGSRRHGWADKSVQVLEALHLEQPFDLVWSQSFDGFGLSRKGVSWVTQLPLLATLHGCIAQEFASFIENLRRHWFHSIFFSRGLAGLFYSYFVSQRPLLRHADRIITVSRKVAEDLFKWYGRAIAGKCVTVYNGVDTTIFHPDEEARKRIRRRFELTPEIVLLLSLGRLTHEKGHHLLIEAMTHLRKKDHPVKLMIVGEGEDAGHLQTLVKQFSLDDHVIFTGPVDNHETASFYNAADLFLFPTLTVEGLPFVILEAMACGIPIIASDLGGNREAIRNGEDGILIPPGSSRRIVTEIEALICDRVRTNRLRMNALGKIHQTFSLIRMLDRMEEEMLITAGLREASGHSRHFSGQ